MIVGTRHGSERKVDCRAGIDYYLGWWREGKLSIIIASLTATSFRIFHQEGTSCQ
jgi:hypothetical protein